MKRMLMVLLGVLLCFSLAFVSCGKEEEGESEIIKTLTITRDQYYWTWQAEVDEDEIGADFSFQPGKVYEYEFTFKASRDMVSGICILIAQQRDGSGGATGEWFAVLSEQEAVFGGNCHCDCVDEILQWIYDETGDEVGKIADPDAPMIEKDEFYTLSSTESGEFTIDAAIFADPSRVRHYLAFQDIWLMAREAHYEGAADPGAAPGAGTGPGKYDEIGTDVTLSFTKFMIREKAE